MKSILAAAAITAAIAGLVAIPARAAVIAFDTTGTFDDGATLSGTVTINTTTGVVTAVNLDVSAPDSLALDLLPFQQADYPVAGIYGVEAAASALTYPVFGFGIPVSSLVGYDGGQLISDSHQGPGSYTSTLYLSATDAINLEQGALSPPVAAMPEPSSILVLSTAVLVLGTGAVFRRHRT